ncbi:signal peptide peptidase-like 3 isoform X2 [Lingula anatina]|uniref:Signal peptide peptidase-like 3 isoform X2 n=1 Tax=Lingula anatina TaxID=7574 RepID=A0A1S3HI32_LINAN|nr:signal peptide peptidase-like 3 isoform X2 [Lingula anatina]|eukprot:XP_013384649.1 signal peptide peptidase-like 3 isoform X2 [Lingula anatina]
MGHPASGHVNVHVAQNMDQIGAYSIMDSSRVSTFIISILLIVYGSFRSLNLDQENRQKQEKDGSFSVVNGGENSNQSSEADNVQTIDSCQAMFLPIGASISLLIMFLFFDSLQMVFAVCTAMLATIAFAFLLLPMCQYLLRPCSSGQKKSFGYCGRFTAAEILSFCMSVCIVCTWVLTGHWLLMDALGMGLCVAFIALVRLPSLKVSTLLLLGLLLYDVFWVFFSSFIFSTNVMVKVATRPAENPVGAFAKKFHLTGLMRDAPKLSLPGKLVFPSMHNEGHFSMLGLGDIVMPGLLLCFVMRYDAYKRGQVSTADTGLPPPPQYYHKITYFHCSLIGYFLGLLTATVSSEVFRAAQPALLYLVPFTLLPLLTMAYLKGDLRRMWSEPFLSPAPSKYMDV